MLLIPINISIIVRIYINRAIVYYSYIIEYYYLRIYFDVHQISRYLIWEGKEDYYLCCIFMLLLYKNLWLRLCHIRDRYYHYYWIATAANVSTVNRKSVPFFKLIHFFVMKIIEALKVTRYIMSLNIRLNHNFDVS